MLANGIEQKEAVDREWGLRTKSVAAALEEFAESRPAPGSRLAAAGGRGAEVAGDLRERITRVEETVKTRATPNQSAA